MGDGLARAVATDAVNRLSHTSVTPTMPNTTQDRFGALLLGAAALLFAALIAAVSLTGPLSWIVGIVYICYDTWLLGHMVRTSRRAIAADLAQPAPTATTPPLSLTVLISARNERAALPATLDSVLTQDGGADKVIVIDDGSTDDTLAVLAERYGVRFADGAQLGDSPAIPGLAVLRKPNSGKARSLNAALALCDTDLVVTLDADTVLDPGALAAARRAFANPELTAACGVLRPSAQPGPLAPMFELYQTFEYMRSFIWRVSWASEKTLVLVSGAFSIFRREPLAAVGGFDPTSHVEDYELLFRLHRASLEGRGRPLDVRVIGDAGATTDVPSHPRVFLRQRTRWFAGFVETMFRNRDMVGNARFGRLGTFHLLVKTIDTLLPLYGLSAFLALVLFLVRGQGIPWPILAALAAKFVFDFSCHTYCLFLHERWRGRRVTARLFGRAALATLTEPYFFQFFRQLGAMLGWVAFLRGRTEWSPQRPVHLPAERVEE
jgi:cellulose synthase/poly-beta-1,6-N-acetylglucosamine synthase-like glycosyltransferase